MLRAVVVMAGAGLDATVKQILKDAFDTLCESSEETLEAVRAHVARRLRRAGEDGERDSQGRADLLISESPKKRAIAMLREALLSESMQSYEQLHRVTKCLGIGDEFLVKRKAAIAEAVKTRNEIIHEMDVAEPGKRRVRRPRRKDEMQEKAMTLLEVAEHILREVDKQLGGR